MISSLHLAAMDGELTEIVWAAKRNDGWSIGASRLDNAFETVGAVQRLAYAVQHIMDLESGGPISSLADVNKMFEGADDWSSGDIEPWGWPGDDDEPHD